MGHHTFDPIAAAGPGASVHYRLCGSDPPGLASEPHNAPDGVNLAWRRSKHRYDVLASLEVDSALRLRFVKTQSVKAMRPALSQDKKLSGSALT